jgi:hypothetical protein
VDGKTLIGRSAGYRGHTVGAGSEQTGEVIHKIANRLQQIVDEIASAAAATALLHHAQEFCGFPDRYVYIENEGVWERFECNFEADLERSDAGRVNATAGGCVAGQFLGGGHDICNLLREGRAEDVGDRFDGVSDRPEAGGDGTEGGAKAAE